MTSTLKFDRWQNTSGTTIADVSSGGFPGRNLLYNGAMQVAQRGTSSTGITSAGYYTADRWAIYSDSPVGTYTQTVEADGPTGSGFTRSFKMECTTANSSPAAGDRLVVVQRIEGQDLQGLKKGTADAESLTLSFWVKSNVTGTYIAELVDVQNARSISASYSVSSSGTWEKKTITFAGDTTGVLTNDNGNRFNLNFWLLAGSNWTSGSLNTSWGTWTPANRAVGQTNLAASTSNYWQVTGVQLEAGTVATTFEHKAYGVELAECQRYYYLHAQGINRTICTTAVFNSTLFYGTVFFPQQMRAIPSLVITTGSAYYVHYSQAASDNLTTLSASTTVATENAAEISGTIAVNRQGASSFLRNGNANSYVAWDSEL